MLRSKITTPLPLLMDENSATHLKTEIVHLAQTIFPPTVLQATI